MIKALIENYKELTIVGVFAILMSWYLWHQTKQQAKREDKRDEQQAKREAKINEQQDEDRLFHRNLITNDLKSLHEDGIKNTELNAQSIVLQKDMIQEFKEHNGHNKVFQEKAIESLGLICNRLNGENSKMKTAKKNLKTVKEKN